MMDNAAMNMDNAAICIQVFMRANAFISLGHIPGNGIARSCGKGHHEAPILWPPDAKSQLIGKGPDAGKDCGQEDKGVTEDEMVGWLNGHESKQTPEAREGQGSLVCCNPRGRKESDTTGRLNNKW